MTTHGADVSVAVAANFTAPMQELARLFARKTGHNARLSFGSSGKFYAQISNGAPFEVFLSADQTKPEALEKAGLVVAHSRFTYAEGALVLWSADPGVNENGETVLVNGDFNKLAIANPRLAPYGEAALQVLRHLGVEDRLEKKLVLGENISQTYQFVGSGNAEVGLIALSQVYLGGQITHGSGWIVPDSLYDAIRQDAVLLTRGEDNPAATALLEYMQSATARDIIQRYGYHLPARY